MDQKRTIAALGTLAQVSRLDLFRLLPCVRTEGLPAGEITERLGVQPSSPSFHLAPLVHADLITQRCLRRQLIYSVSGSGVSMTALGVRRDKAALSSGCKPHPAIRSSRKQPEQARRRRNV
jgi:DNA-binding transcriptional ArsR family regulator